MFRHKVWLLAAGHAPRHVAVTGLWVQGRLLLLQGPASLAFPLHAGSTASSSRNCTGQQGTKGHAYSTWLMTGELVATILPSCSANEQAGQHPWSLSNEQTMLCISKLDTTWCTPEYRYLCGGCQKGDSLPTTPADCQEKQNKHIAWSLLTVYY